MTRDDILWFKTQFASDIVAAVQGTPFTVDLVTAIACQETGFIWAPLRRKGLPVSTILATCVGDVIDGPKRSPFPRSKSELQAAPNGARMFAIARQALVDMAVHRPEYQKFADQPNRFCHAFGIFQYDLQHYATDAAHFLDQRYLQFRPCLDKALVELKAAQRRNGLQGRGSLSEMELVSVAIAYNAGRFDPKKGLMQGHFDGTQFYGQYILDFLRMAGTVPTPSASPRVPPAAGVAVPVPVPPPLVVAVPGEAVVPPPTPVTEGTVFAVNVSDSPLRLRSAPEKIEGNTIARLPDGHRVVALSTRPVNGFLQVETSLRGALLRGFAARDFLVAVRERGATVPVPQPAREVPTDGVTAVFMPRKGSVLTRRSELANAFSLNEPNMPGRTGTNPAALRAEIDAIVDFLAVDRASHRRYQPRDGMTFCNIYAHDFCTLAGTYLPRVWWTGPALVALGGGQAVTPLIGQSIREMRANDLYRWLADFGLTFGWRQTGTLTKLQQEVNQGAIGLIIARRRDDARPGHVAMVVPESAEATARRDASGNVAAALQSQAGSTNFRRSPGRRDWFLDDNFAEHAFWLHA